MSDAISPALTAEEWAHREFVRGVPRREHQIFGYVGEEDGLLHLGWDAEPLHPVTVNSIPAVLALANAALEDDDKRKITREWVAELRELVTLLRDGSDIPRLAERTAVLSDAADALASYLPPEEP